ncbi:MAG TPA: DUF2169 domain-containing protein [Polyangia bacterium]|nr:DUF2169 domain-containing protein [Polyangia bacterium]
MDLQNYTPFPALLMRFGATEDVMGGSLVARVTYDLLDGALVQASEQSWIVSPKPWECEYGPMESDEVFYKGGTDLFLFGSAQAPRGRPVYEMTLSIEVGTFRRDILVLGDRAWIPRVKGVAMTDPQPFVTMPLTMDRAYGGKSEWDGLEVPFADNPNGRGFCLELEQAIGQRLPNLENPLARIARWDDRPAPVGVGICSQAHSGRLAAGVTFGKGGAMKKIHPRLFNAAFPEMVVVGGVQPGAAVRLTGFKPDGPITFVVPEVPVVFRLTLGTQATVRTPQIDQIGIEADKQRVFITYRYPFRYVLYARQRRTAELWPAPTAKA